MIGSGYFLEYGQVDIRSFGCFLDKSSEGTCLPAWASTWNSIVLAVRIFLIKSIMLVVLLSKISQRWVD